MAIENKNLYNVATRVSRIEGEGCPVVTADEVAVEIQTETDFFGNTVASGFTSLSDFLQTFNPGGLKKVECSYEDYLALESKDSDTLYLITQSEETE